MAVQAVLTSESLSDGLESSSITRNYLINDDTNIAVSYSAALTAMTALGTTETVNSKVLKVKSRTLEREPEGLQKWWRGTVNYEWSATDGDNAATAFVSIDLTTSTQFVDVWRTGATFPTPINNPPNTDIGGVSVDSCGEPVSTLLNQQEMTVTNVATTNNATAILGAIGKRNSVSFLGAGQDYVLFVGASSRRTGVNQYEIQYRFLYDGAKHLRQVCVRDVDGQPVLNAPDTNGNATAKTVYARQPFPTTTNLLTDLGLSVA